MDDPGLPAAARMVGGGRVLRSAALLGAATVLVKLAALAKDLLVARQLGAGDALDAYLMAFLLPSFAVVVLAQTFASAFVPAYVRVWQQRSLAEAQRLAGRVLLTATGVLLVAVVALLAAAPLVLSVLAINFDAQKLTLTVSLFYLLAGVLVASGLSAVLGAILNAHERFAATALAPLAVPLATLVVFAIWNEHYGVYALAAGTLVGFVLETVLLVLATAACGLFPPAARGLRNADLADELHEVGAQYWPVAVGGLLMSSSMLVDQSMAASLGSGQVSVLSYGGKVVAVVLSVVALSLSTVLLPRFSHLIAAGQRRQFTRLFKSYAVAILVLSIPGVALLALVTEPVVRLLFERGAFTPETTLAVSRVQLWLLPQIPFYVVNMIGARVLSALGGNAIVLRLGALNLVLNVCGNYVLMRWYGVEGIAMSTSLMYVVAAWPRCWQSA